jgi:WS/DGAT/MGAT family acyltransferase
VELKRFISRLIPLRFAADRPWWDLYYVDSYQGGAALVTRIHHCYADGIALINVLLGMTDTTAGAPVPKVPKRGRRPRIAAADEAQPTLTHLIEPLGDVLDRAIRLSGDVVDKSIDVLREPSNVIDYARIAARATNDAAALALMPNDSRTRFKGKPGAAKRVAWSAKLPLDEVKAISKALDCSLNDVLLACVAGALRSYLVEKGDRTEGVECRAMVPVNLRPPGREPRLGNYFGLAPLLLPVGIANPLKRVYEVSSRMTELKGSFTPALALGLLGLMGVVPKMVEEEILLLMANKSTAVMTNVPGPQQPLYLAGREIREQMFWVPQSGDIGMGVSILSYNGSVQFGVITDAKLVPDPERLIGEFEDELEKLLLAVLMDPWDEKRNPSLVERAITKATARWTRLRALTGAQPAPNEPVAATTAPAVARSPAAKHANGSGAPAPKRTRKPLPTATRTRRASRAAPAVAK